MNSILTINIDYHHSPLGLTIQDMNTVATIGFPITEIFRFCYNLYLNGALIKYQTKQEVLSELLKYTGVYQLTENEYELEVLATYLYNPSAFSPLETQIAQCTDLILHGKLKSRYAMLKTIIATRGKYVDTLCKTVLQVNNYLLDHSAYYFNPLNVFSSKHNLPFMFIKTGAINICGGWVVVEFNKG